jgi:hypothetical protein
MIATGILSLLLIGLSGVLLDMHRRRWRRAEQNSALSTAERRFARSQYRRRVQASGTIGVLGVTIALWPLVPLQPWPFTLYLAWVGGACLAITMLAAMDAWATRQHFARLHGEHLAAQVTLARELRREANGETEKLVRQESK